MNKSVAVNQSITLSWKLTYTAQEKSQVRIVEFKRYVQQNNSLTVVQIGAIGFFPPSSNPHYTADFSQRIAVVKSASAITEPAITIQDATKQDEAFYRIEVSIGTPLVPVDNHTIFLTVFGNYVLFTYCGCTIDFT